MISRRKFFQTAAVGSAGLAVGGTSAVARNAVLTTRALLASAGTEGPAPGGYTRMFPNLKPASVPSPLDTEIGLHALGEAMVDQSAPTNGMRESRPTAPTAGYTYFGQFIDHDLTLDLTSLAHAGLNADSVEQIQNFRTPYLDLDQLYGGGPNLSPFLYRNETDPSQRGKEQFLIGKTSAGTLDDLPRNPEGIALTADPRQDENLILAQLHVAFLKLHNFVISQPQAMSASPLYRRQGDSDFAVAQRIVRWHYQWIVRHDYLETITNETVGKNLANLERTKRALPPKDFRIPVEFSAAAFRFGHSMVRNSYDSINKQQKNVALQTLLYLTGSQGLTPPGDKANVALPAEWRVCWNRFFEIPPHTTWLNSAETIDTKIAGSLHHLDEPRLKQFSIKAATEVVEPSLPVRTLLRGFRMGLPSGEQVAKEVAKRMPGIKVLKEDEIIGGPHEEILKNPKYGLRKNTPLWYYILKEAELEKVPLPGTANPLPGANPPKFANGISLGPVGSYIVADTLLGALVADQGSYLWGDYPNWQPTLQGTSSGQGRSMANLLALVSTPDPGDDHCD